ncbi:MAG TPA: tetratricopeptide repeat-containing protein [Vicinamibacterales bacterium]|nr:tetratricopeptide repeat-containing protein [Vicinamibacterales bacterium]
MRVFVVRPFGEKEGIDFERVDRELIQAALARLAAQGIQVAGGTTAEINRAGNIREDMFRLLVVADLVIADVSIHNANVFYELGIRHALRPRHTFMIRSATTHKYPFDLQTDRYLLYDSGNPAGDNGAMVMELAAALRSTLAADPPSSPVFQLLPALKPHDRQSLVRVPADFAEDVERARQNQRFGDLRLFAQEILGLEWDQEGLRLIGEAQFKLRAYNGAKETFEALRAELPDDLRVNQRLATIYQKLAFVASGETRERLLTESDLAIGRALNAATRASDRAEVLALQASNVKSRWFDEFRACGSTVERCAAALRSARLSQTVDTYLRAFAADLNAYYPGVNALALLQAQIALAGRAPEEWAPFYDNDTDATVALERKKQLAARVTATLSLALRVDDTLRGLDDAPPDPWSKATRADLLLLTVPNKPQRVTNAYREALTGVDWFALEAARRNLGIFADLELFEPNVSAALKVIDDAIAASRAPQALPDRVILFTGHMVDAPDRDPAKARFPRTPEAEATARGLIEDALKKELQEGENVFGIAGGACGSDILFHEVCEAMGVPTKLYLALPVRQFQVASVQRGGPDWVDRYQKLCERLPAHVLQDTEALPDWLADKRGYDIWQRNNEWMLFHALATNARRLTLIALYNPDRDADGPGGTAHLVGLAKRWGFKSIELDARKLLGSG